MPHRAFTLIELLVVVTIIVVLLALLTPALDKAMGRAELAICAARLKAHANAALMYAGDYKRSYVYREPVRNGTAWRPDYLTFTGQNPRHDDRPALRPYMAIDKLVACPFVKEIDFDRAEQPGNLVPGVLNYISYAYWYGFKYVGRRGMYRLGDKLEWHDGTTGKSHLLNVLVSDTDINEFNSQWTNCAHPDRKNFLALTTVVNSFFAPAQSYVNYSYWGRWGALPARGAIDQNFAFDDGSVQMWNDVVIDDDRLIAVGGHSGLTSSGYGTDTGYRTWLPER
jgi:prepilin-type N-terminal cleavage/methylation domain-containing protein